MDSSLLRLPPPLDTLTVPLHPGRIAGKNGMQDLFSEKGELNEADSKSASLKLLIFEASANCSFEMNCPLSRMSPNRVVRDTPIT